MRAAERSAVGAGSQLKRQIPSFVAIGFFGFFVDAGVTYFLAQGFGVAPALARPPGFAIATVINFALNRGLTFRATATPLARAFVRYVMVCAAGLGVNYSVYLACIALAPLFGLKVTPAILPLFVACGCGAAMFLTFVGFRFFAFRA
ncbi:MAG: GtrA family protein [Roseiarcus sp.]